MNVRTVVLEVILEGNTNNEYRLSENSKHRLRDTGYCPNTLQKLGIDGHPVENGNYSDEGHIGNGYYLVKDIESTKIDPKTQERLVLASYAGYSEDENQ